MDKERSTDTIAPRLLTDHGLRAFQTDFVLNLVGVVPDATGQLLDLVRHLANRFGPRPGQYMNSPFTVSYVTAAQAKEAVGNHDNQAHYPTVAEIDLGLQTLAPLPLVLSSPDHDLADIVHISEYLDIIGHMPIPPRIEGLNDTHFAVFLESIFNYTFQLIRGNHHKGNQNIVMRHDVDTTTFRKLATMIHIPPDVNMAYFGEGCWFFNPRCDARLFTPDSWDTIPNNMRLIRDCVIGLKSMGYKVDNFKLPLDHMYMW